MRLFSKTKFFANVPRNAIVEIRWTIIRRASFRARSKHLQINNNYSFTAKNMIVFSHVFPEYEFLNN